MKKWWIALLLALASAAPGWAQNQPVVIRASQGTTIQDIGDGANGVNASISDNANRLLGKITFVSAQHIVCDSGCGSPPASADVTLFDYGVTNVAPVAFVAQATTSTSVTEGYYGAAAMSLSRILYIDYSKSAGSIVAQLVPNGDIPFQTELLDSTGAVITSFNPLPVSFSGGLSVSQSEGIFISTPNVIPWQNQIQDASSYGDAGFLSVSDHAAHVKVISFPSDSTFPLAVGAAVAAKQPAFGAAGKPARDVLSVQGAPFMAPLKVAGTFYQDTQPVSGTFWQTTQPVSGTFFQSTQPVSIASMPSTPVTGTFWQVTQPVSIASMPSTPVTGTFWQVTQPVSGTVTTSPPANASTNVAQLAGTTTDTNSGSKSAGTLRVVIATDQPALTNKLLVTPDSVALPANQSVNVNQIVGTAADVNSGLKSAGTLRVVLATDQPALTNKLLVTPDSVALPANQSVNVAQLAGTTTDTNSGLKSAGTLRIVLATDQPALTNKLLVTPDANSAINVAQIGGSAVTTAATGVQKVGVVGNAGAIVDAANNASMPANALATGLQTATIDTSPTAATAGNLRYQLASTEGVTYVQEGGPKRFSCVLQAVTALTQCQAAPASGLRAYVTSFSASNQAATVQTLDIVYGTGTNCATAAVAISHKWQFGTNGTTTSPYDVSISFPTPLVPAAANAICVRPSAASAFGATITGYIAP